MFSPFFFQRLISPFIFIEQTASLEPGPSFLRCSSCGHAGTGEGAGEPLAGPVAPQTPQLKQHNPERLSWGLSRSHREHSTWMEPTAPSSPTARGAQEFQGGTSHLGNSQGEEGAVREDSLEPGIVPPCHDTVLCWCPLILRDAVEGVAQAR